MLSVDVPAFDLMDRTTTLYDGEIDSWAVYADLDREISETLSLQVGARYYSDQRELIARDLIDSVLFGLTAGDVFGTKGSDSDFAPHLALTWSSGDHLLYGRLAKGFRSGRTNIFFNFRPDQIPESIEPERLLTFELGSKNQLADSRLQLNAFLYFNDWSEIQIERITEDGLFFFDDNVAAAESRGLELEMLARPSRGLLVSFNASYIDAEFTEDLLEFGEVVVAKGNALPYSPKWTLSTSLEYQRPMENGWLAVIAGYYSHREDNFSTPNNELLGRNDAQNQVRLRGGVEGRNWAFFAYVDNALNEDTTTFKLRPVRRVPLTYFTQVRPRTYGIELTWRF